jgi:putative transposase
LAWKETCRVGERRRFMTEWERQIEQGGGRINMSALCRAFGVSRQTGYKWLQRYVAAGRSIGALEDISRRPKRSPRTTPEPIVRVILEARRMHPGWGARKLRAWLMRRAAWVQNQGLDPSTLPTPSTFGAVLRREGLTRPRPKRARTPPFAQPFVTTTEPNGTWCVDFKGQFRTQDGRQCYPLTVMDAFSRKLLCCKALHVPNGRRVRKEFEATFAEYGLPTAIRSDNGPPFASVGIGGLSTLSVWWAQLRIRHERIEPGKPQQNGRHERMHRTLKQDATSPPARTLRAQQKIFDQFQLLYNGERPHEALGGKTPNDVYSRSTRLLPKQLEPFEYPPDCQVRRVRADGLALLGRRKVKVGTALAGQSVAFRWLGDTNWEIHFGPITLGILDLRTEEIIGRRHSKRGPPFREAPLW